MELEDSPSLTFLSARHSFTSFDLVKSGTFMYHPHADEMVQMAMGMMGFFVVQPKDQSSCESTGLCVPPQRL